MMSLGYQIGTIGFATIPTLVRLGRYLPRMNARRVPRALLIAALALIGVPLRALQRLVFGRRLARVRIQQPPVFIIGHWRSGTTHLHNLMSQDPAFGYVSMYQAIAPGCTLIGGRWLERLLARIVPEKRPMDNMTWPTGAPQEEEIPLGKTLPYSFYVQFLFPGRARTLFRRYVLLDGAPRRAAAEWKRKYLRLLQVATWHAGGRRLLLKNPVNTARIRLLLALFPDAKFVHISRSPYDVLPSTRKLHRSLLAFTSLEQVTDAEIDATVFDLYETMMRRYLADRALIPTGNLVEVRFEDLEADPIGVVQRVYGALALPGFGRMLPRVRAYVASQAGYRKNRFRTRPEDVDAVEHRWAFAFDALGHEPRRLADPAAHAAEPMRRSA
jgi:hypothetical protein